MPEMIEVEDYRRVAERTVGRTVRAVEAPDDWYLKGDTTARALWATVTGRTVTGTRRIGKLLLLDTDGGAGPVVGLRFGMTGRLLVDGNDAVGELLYTSKADRPEWDRFALGFEDGGVLRMQDPRRLGGVVLDPTEGALGVDAATVTLAGLRSALGASAAPLKARLMNQAHVAGVGNLLADEALWRAGLDPRRPARDLTPAELRRLHRHLRATVAELSERGGSHTGDLRVHRAPGGRCPKDGAVLERSTVGGRTTWWCPQHQR
jgi:formamidopyrimidine-DNA glycosylase